MPPHSSLFPRSFHKDYPHAVGGEGCWIWTTDGKKYLDAAGQAAVVNIGHGVESVGRAMAEQAARLADPGAVYARGLAGRPTAFLCWLGQGMRRSSFCTGRSGFQSKKGSPS